MPDQRGAALDRGLVVLAVAVSGFVLFAPTAPGPPLFMHADKIVHAGVFGALAWTASRAGVPTRWLAPALVAYAVGSEVVQHTVLPGRSGDWTDVVADLAGAGLGLWLAAAHPARRARRGR